MNNNNIIVDMQSPTPLDEYRYSTKGVVDIFISKKDSSSSYSLELRDKSLNKPILLDSCIGSMLHVWKLIEMFRVEAYKSNKIVNVHDMNSNATYKKISIATTLKQEEVEEAVERQSRLAKSTRRRMVVGTPYSNRKRKPIDPKLCRPITREERTW
jgi:hypothetical protein